MALTFLFKGLFRLGGRRDLRTRLLDLQLITHEDGLVCLDDSLISLCIVGHFYEAIALRSACFVIHNDFAGLHLSKLFEQGSQVFCGGLKC